MEMEAVAETEVPEEMEVLMAAAGLQDSMDLPQWAGLVTDKADK